MSTTDLRAQSAEVLPGRHALSTTVPSLALPVLDPSSVAGYWAAAGAASGDAEQTAPITQGLTNPPALPVI
jgi:hypothetical protein